MPACPPPANVVQEDNIDPSIRSEASPAAARDDLQQALSRCRKLGRDRSFDRLLDLALATINSIPIPCPRSQRYSTNCNDPAVVKRTSAATAQPLASLHGYAGYALFHLNRHTDAVAYLETAVDLFGRPQTKIHQREFSTAFRMLCVCYRQNPARIPLPRLIKYPRTVHLFDSGGTATTSDDLVLASIGPIASLLAGYPSNANHTDIAEHNAGPSTRTIVIEEKNDGSNLGISLCPYSNKLLVQNRSHYISQGDHPQYSRVAEWLAVHQPALQKVLAPNGCHRKILFGEWMAARHSLPYHRLPGLFVAFDLYDASVDRFVSRRRFHSIMRRTDIPVSRVITDGPLIATPLSGSTTTTTTTTDTRGNTDLSVERAVKKELMRLLDTKSVFRTDQGTVEGIVIRIDNGDWLEDKYKIVRPDFLQCCSDGPHWSRRRVEAQRIDYEFAESYLASCYEYAEDTVDDET